MAKAEEEARLASEVQAEAEAAHKVAEEAAAAEAAAVKAHAEAEGNANFIRGVFRRRSTCLTCLYSLL